jgi:hypothetical protein
VIGASPYMTYGSLIFTKPLFALANDILTFTKFQRNLGWNGIVPGGHSARSLAYATFRNGPESDPSGWMLQPTSARSNPSGWMLQPTSARHLAYMSTHFPSWACQSRTWNIWQHPLHVLRGGLQKGMKNPGRGCCQMFQVLD